MTYINVLNMDDITQMGFILYNDSEEYIPSKDPRPRLGHVMFFVHRFTGAIVKYSEFGVESKYFRRGVLVYNHKLYTTMQNLENYSKYRSG